MTVVMWAAALLLAVILIGIIIIVLIAGLPTLSWDFITTSSSYSATGGGIGPLLWLTGYTLVLSLLVTVPIGIAGAVYLNEYARPGTFTNIVRFSNESLASIPSIVYGIFGSILFVRILGAGLSVIAGVLTLAVLNLPLAVRLAEDALKGVPGEFREGSEALGASPWETIRKVILPSALPGFVTLVVLVAGRVIGESAPIIMTMGTTVSPNAEYSLNPLNTGTTLAVHIWVLKVLGVPGLENSTGIAAASALVLLLGVLYFNLVASVFIDRSRRRLEGR
jgi:phosphate transport system permease protein